MLRQEKASTITANKSRTKKSIKKQCFTLKRDWITNLSFFNCTEVCTKNNDMSIVFQLNSAIIKLESEIIPNIIYDQF